MGYGQYSAAGKGNALARGEARKPQRKFVFGSHDQTAHVWAQQSEETLDGRSGDGRIRFEGPTIYSYGHHFPMAHFTGKLDGNGRDIVLFNDRGYSVSTGKHKSIVRGALHGLSVVVVAVPDLKEYLGARGPKLAAIKREMWSEALENYAAALIGVDEHGEDSWYAYRRDDAKAHLASLRVIGIKRDQPADIRAWYRDLVAKRAKQAEDLRVAKARKLIRSYDNMQTVKSPEPGASSYNLKEAIANGERRLTALRSARLTLSKAKRFPAMVKRASLIIKTLQPALEAFRVAHTETLAREARQGEINTLRDLDKRAKAAGWPDDFQHSALWNYETIGRLWAAAIREGFKRLPAYLARRLHLIRWNMEVPDTFKRYERSTLSPEQWQNGEGTATALGYGEPTLVRRKGDVLQTSRGAECPFAHAVLAYQQAQRCRMTGATWHANGHKIKVGHYGVDSIDASGDLVAGCHRLGFEEMTRLAVREVPEIVRPCFPLPVPVEG